MRLAIYGTGGMAADIIEPLREKFATLDWPPEMVLVDDNPPARERFGLPILRLSDLRPGDHFILAMGDGNTRERLDYACREAGLKPFSFVANTCRVDPGAEIGSGALVADFSLIPSTARIGRQFQCNMYSYVSHDCVIGDYVTFAPRVGCNGNVHIEDHAYIGAGAVIKNGVPGKPLVIGRGAIVGMGAVVTKDVPPGVTVKGNPAA